jgi:CPA2 family monovalent cation:H+ antiporter-2
VIYGDATQSVILEAAGIEKSRLLIVTTPVALVSQAIVSHVKNLHPDLHIVTRAETLDQMKMFQEQGVYHVVQPEFEAGLEFARLTLLHLSVPAERIQKFTDEIRRELYRPLYDSGDKYHLIKQIENITHLLALHWVSLPKGARLVGCSIADCGIRAKTGATVAGVIRKGILYPNPSPEFVFRENDVVGVIGGPEEFRSFQELARGQ